MSTTNEPGTLKHSMEFTREILRISEAFKCADAGIAGLQRFVDLCHRLQILFQSYKSPAENHESQLVDALHVCVDNFMGKYENTVLLEYFTAEPNIVHIPPAYQALEQLMATAAEQVAHFYNESHKEHVYAYLKPFFGHIPSTFQTEAAQFAFLSTDAFGDQESNTSTPSFLEPIPSFPSAHFISDDLPEISEIMSSPQELCKENYLPSVEEFGDIMQTGDRDPTRALSEAQRTLTKALFAISNDPPNLVSSTSSDDALWKYARSASEDADHEFRQTFSTEEDGDRSIYISSSSPPHYEPSSDGRNDPLEPIVRTDPNLLTREPAEKLHSTSAKPMREEERKRVPSQSNPNKENVNMRQFM